MLRNVKVQQAISGWDMLTKVDIRLVISGGEMLTNANIQAVIFRRNWGKISMHLFKKCSPRINGLRLKFQGEKPSVSSSVPISGDETLGILETLGRGVRGNQSKNRFAI